MALFERLTCADVVADMCVSLSRVLCCAVLYRAVLFCVVSRTCCAALSLVLCAPSRPAFTHQLAHTCLCCTAGIGLLEIVTAPDIRSAGEAVEFVRALQRLLRHIGAGDCNMEDGSLRCDVNVSIRPDARPREPVGICAPPPPPDSRLPVVACVFEGWGWEWGRV